MFQRLYRLVTHKADELLVAAVVLVGAAIYYMPGLLPLLSSQGFIAKNAESTQVYNRVHESFAKDSPAVIVVAKDKQGRPMADPAVKPALNALAADIAKEEGVERVQGYHNTGQPDFISKDGKSTFVAVSIAGDIDAQEKIAARVREHVVSKDFDLAYAGSALINHDITEQIGKDLALAETVSFTLLGILLVIVFRGLVAALLPLLLGAFSVLVAMLVLRGMAEATTIVEYALNVIVLIGLGLAVDYSLLMVSRFREELVAHKGDVDAALNTTMHTAGRTIFFSGVTVIISLLALVIFPLDFLRSMGLGGAAAVLVAMGGALVVLPSLLKLLGHRVNWLSFGGAKAMDTAMRSGKTVAEKASVWRKTGAFFMRWPVVTLLVVLAMVALTVTPFWRIKLSSPDVSVLPETSSVRQATERLQRDFSFTESPINIIYTSNGAVTDPESIGHLYDYTQALRKLEHVRSVDGLASLPGQQLTREQYQQFYQHLDRQPTAVQEHVKGLIAGNSTFVAVGYEGETMSGQTQALVAAIRGQPTPGATAQIGGQTAQLVDLLAILAKYIPWALLAIGVTLFVLLFLMLGSVVLPLVAMFQNILSLGVSFGALVWIFQEGHLANLLHMNMTGSIDATQPVLIFAVAFGLSMDYSVFLYSRIKEEYDRTQDSKQAVLSGLQKTGSIITSAAILLFVVVAAFATSRISIMQEIGVGLALAILVDAFVVRMVLVPATMRLLGNAAWWTPAFLRGMRDRFAIKD